MIVVHLCRSLQAPVIANLHRLAMWDALAVAALLLLQLFLPVDAALSPRLAPFSLKIFTEGSRNPNRLPLPGDRATVAGYSQENWESILVQCLDLSEEVGARIVGKRRFDEAAKRLGYIMQEGLSYRKMSLSSIGSHRSSDSNSSQDSLGYISCPMYKDFKNFLAQALVGLEACLRLGADSSLMQDHFSCLNTISQQVPFELIAANGCTKVFTQRFQYARISDYIELIWSGLVPCHEIVKILGSILKSLSVNDLTALFERAIRASRLAVVDFIIRSKEILCWRSEKSGIYQPFLKMPLKIVLIEQVEICADPLMYAISIEKLRDNPKLLISMLSMLLEHRLATGVTSVTAPISIDLLFMIPSTPLELAVHYGCKEAIKFLVNMLSPSQVRYQVSQAIFFAPNMDIFCFLASPKHSLADLQACRNGVSLWASAAFSGNLELVEYLNNANVPHAISGSIYPPIIAALLQPDKNFEAICRMIKFLLESCRMNVKDTVSRNNLFDNYVLLGFDASHLFREKQCFTALEVAEILASKYPAAESLAVILSRRSRAHSSTVP